MQLSRRSFLSAMLAASAGPAIVRVASLMPVKVLATGDLVIAETAAFPSNVTFAEIVMTTMRHQRSAMLECLIARNALTARLTKNQLNEFRECVCS